MPKQSSNSTGLIGHILRIATLVLSFLLLISILSPVFNPHQLWFPAFFGLAYPYIALLTLMLTIIMLFFNYKKAIFPLLIFIIGIGTCKHTIHLSASKNTFTSDETEIKILSQNVHLMGAYDRSGKITTDSVLNIIASESPDIACFQEFYTRDKITGKSCDDFMHAGMFNNYVASLYADSTTDTYLSIVTFTKFPVIKKGVVRTKEKSERNIFALWCDLHVNSDTVRVYNVHLQSIGFTSNEESLFDENEKNNKEFETKSKSTARKLKRAFIGRSIQVEALASNIDSCKYPVFLVGDFNDTPVSHTYRKLRGKLKDAFLDSGSRGIGKTYNGPFPSFRIDYMFFPDKYESAEFKVLNRYYSDHFPISCRFRKIK
jgi:endonuclease/exonuclease/phosphatase family metal-dependent hydrolase